jgi:hypothetical protein
LFTTVPRIETGKAGSVSTAMTRRKPSAIRYIIGTWSAVPPAPPQPARRLNAARRDGDGAVAVVIDTFVFVVVVRW